MKARLFILLGLTVVLALLVPGVAVPTAAQSQPRAPAIPVVANPSTTATPPIDAVNGLPNRLNGHVPASNPFNPFRKSVDSTTGTTTRVSVASDGSQGNDESWHPSISADGRYVAFYSFASDLVSGDTNNVCDTDGDGQYDDNCPDVFVHDQQTGQTTRVSVASDGSQGNDGSAWPSISADGRYVAFRSAASNLVSGDTNGYGDVFVHDRQMGQTTRVSVASDGTQGNGDSYWSSISTDGRYVAFMSYASNLVSSDTNDEWDVFVHDQQTGQTTRVSVASDGTQGNHMSTYPSISADGRYVAFYSHASNLVSGDTNNEGDVFVHDRQTGQTARVSVASDGSQGNFRSDGRPSISADGRYVAFYSHASNLVGGDTNGDEDVFVHDRQTGQTTRVSVASDGTQGNSWSRYPSISSDGRYVAFFSRASNLVSGDTNGTGDVFVHDQQTGQTTRVSVASDGTQGNGSSAYSSISTTGRYVTFDSRASNLVSSDTNGYRDIFVHDRGGGPGPNCDCNLDKPIIFVHGWHGGANSLQEDEQLGFFVDYLGTDYTENCNLWYAQGVSEDNRLHQNAERIQATLRQAYIHTIACNPLFDGHFDIIAHSMGGINSRAYLESKLYEDDHIHVDNLFTLGTPHGGAGDVPTAYIYLLFHKEFWEDFWRDLPSVGELTGAYMLWFNARHDQPPGVCYRLLGGNINAQHPYLTPLWPVPHDLLVSQSSAHALTYSPLSSKWPRTVKEYLPDMHGYHPSLSSWRSYVRPRTTFDECIKDYLGVSGYSCSSSSSTALETTPSAESTPASYRVTPFVTGIITTGQSLTGSLAIDSSGHTGFYLAWYEGDLDFTLVAPDSTVVNTTTAETDPNVSFLALDALLSTEIYAITDTLPGTWTFTVTAVTLPYTMPYAVYAVLDTPINLALSTDAHWYPSGTPAVITATLMYSNTALTGATVQAEVSHPDGGTETIALLDDGAHNDGEANDGVYGGQYSGTTVGGYYGVIATASGNYLSQDYQRAAQAIFTVSPGTASLSGTYADYPEDNDSNGLYEHLAVDVGVSAVVSGDYSLSAVLEGAGEEFISHAMKEVTLTVGSQVVTLEFDGNDIRDGGLDGPYTVTQVLLLDESEITVKLDEAYDVWTTAAYDHRQFGRPVETAFTASPTSGVAPLTVVFTNTSTGDWTTSLWGFGDGVTSTLESPTHVYTASGTYSVTLRVSGPGGTDEFTRPNGVVVYTNTAPSLSGLPNQIFDQTTSLPSMIDLWAYASDAWTDDSELTYTIDNTPPAGAGVTLDSNRYVTVNPSTTWCGYTDVTIRVTDPGGLWDSDTFRVAVTWSCQGPLPVAGQHALRDEPITIDLTPYEPQVGDGTGLSWYVTGEDHCTVSGEYSDDDVLTFTPQAGFVGSDTVTLRMVYPWGSEATQELTLTWGSGTCDRPGVPVLVAPVDGSAVGGNRPTFEWGAVTGAEEYQIQVDDDADFSSPEREKTTASTEYTPASGLSGGVYYWRVRASNACGTGSWSAIREFTVLTPSPPGFKIYLPVVARNHPGIVQVRSTSRDHGRRFRPTRVSNLVFPTWYGTYTSLGNRTQILADFRR